MGVCKVNFGSETLIDLTGDTVTAADLSLGVTAHDSNGEIITGTNINDADTRDATASASDIQSGKTAYVNGNKITGTSTKDSDTTDATASTNEILSGKTAYVNALKITGAMPDRGSVDKVISTVNEIYSVPDGYHDGSGTVQIDTAEQGKIIPSNIKSGINILGVTGTFTSDSDAVSSDILSGKTAYVDGNKIIGSMSDNGAISGTINSVSGSFAIHEGYHDGSGSVSIDSVEQSKIIPENIKAGVSILGVTGTHYGGLSPYITELNCGYVDGGTWKYENPTQTYVDIYKVISGHRYFLTLGANVGSRFRAMFTEIDISQVTENVTGTSIINKSNPEAYANISHTASADGYIVVAKDNIGKTGIKTYCYDTTEDWL